MLKRKLPGIKPVTLTLDLSNFFSNSLTSEKDWLFPSSEKEEGTESLFTKNSSQ